VGVADSVLVNLSAVAQSGERLEPVSDVLNETYLPFSEEQLREHFVPARTDTTSADRHLDYYRKSVQAYRDKAELGERPPSAGDTVNQVSFNVPGFPPAKNEALSMLGSGHSHASRVLLLELAGQACGAQGFVPVGKGHVALDVVVRAPAGQNPAGATNYLGGIGDALEDKSSRGPLDHLGPLRTVWLYRNDRQITQVSYREVESGQVGYTVTIRSLNS
jgi:hypothetical protein